LGPRLVFDGTEGGGSLFHVLCSWIHFRRYQGRRVLFSCFACSDSFFSGVESVGSLFYVLLARTRFRRYRGRWVLFACFTGPNSFSAVPRVLGTVFMFCLPGIVFGGIGGVGPCFHVLGARTHFRRYRGRRVPFSSFARPDLFSAVPRALGVVFMFCAPGLVPNDNEGVGFLFPCFARPDSFSAVPRTWGPVLMFCALGLIFGGTKGVGYLFHVLRSRTRFRRYRGRRVSFSCFAR
jgi:hypothetical protein